MYSYSCEKFRKDFLRMLKNRNRVQAVAFVINSPGGSAVYSNIISTSIKSFCKDNKLPLLTFTDSVAASGGYWLLCIGDEVYASKHSLVGSVGAVITSMNFKAILDKYQIEREYITTSKYII
jgi:ClpP class serine protease